MKISASVEIAYNIAVQEAIDAEFKEVEPEHFFEALLKMTEIPMYQYKQIASNDAVIQQLNNELQTICEEIHTLKIDSKTVRQNLKTQLGNGKHPFQGGTLHRSLASKELFDRMGSIASDEGTEVILLKHMLKALLESPTTTMVSVFGNVLNVKDTIKNETPTLNEYGVDVINKISNGEVSKEMVQKPECTALVNALSNKKSILLISNNYEVVQSLITAAGYSVLNQKSKPDLINKRIIDISSLKPESSDDITKLNKIFSEASKSLNLILFIPSIESTYFSNDANEWINTLMSWLGKKNIQLICHSQPDTFMQYIENNPCLKRAFQVIWISDKNDMNIPYEL